MSSKHGFSGFFWGVFLVLFGAGIILKAVYHINVPVFKIFFGLLVIAFGLKILLSGMAGRRHPKGGVAAGAGEGEYNVMLGKGTIDLRHLEIAEASCRVEVNVLAGAAALRLNPDVPAKIRAGVAFGSARMGDRSNAAFGTSLYVTKGFREGEPHLAVDANIVLGSLEITD
ncbi:MAG: hypothetical protein GF418_05515 [Chitinivibrionales bacterium]|nr:hypothetical protein [Chitinivibrionales bacterium]MBD3395069.1 hypothetical protein [Chitinivibrionales bacterium]